MRDQSCPACRGTGSVFDDTPGQLWTVECSTCYGTGTTRRQRRGLGTLLIFAMTFSACGFWLWLGDLCYWIASELEPWEWGTGGATG